MTDPERGELARLRRMVALARFYLDRFADPGSFVWGAADKLPHEFAKEALAELDAEPALRDPHDDPEEPSLARGTERMERLAGGRAGFVEFHQLLARQALDVGRVGAARAALRILHSTDFAHDTKLAEALLEVLRDGRATDDEVADAAERLALLVPATK